MFPCPSKMFSLFLSYLHLLSIGITDTHCWDLLFTWYWGSDSDPTLLWQAFYPLAIFSTSRPFPVLPILPSGIMPEYNARSITTPIKPWASASQRLKDFMKWAVGTGREHLFEADLLQLNYKRVSLFNYLHGVRADFKSTFPFQLYNHSVSTCNPPSISTSSVSSMASRGGEGCCSVIWSMAMTPRHRSSGASLPPSVSPDIHSHSHSSPTPSSPTPTPLARNIHTAGLDSQDVFIFFASLKSSFLPAVCALFVY